MECIPTIVMLSIVNIIFLSAVKDAWTEVLNFKWTRATAWFFILPPFGIVASLLVLVTMIAWLLFMFCCMFVEASWDILRNYFKNYFSNKEP